MAGNNNSGRKPLEDEKQVKRDITITPGLWADIKAHTERLGISISAWIRELAKRELDATQNTIDTDA